MAANEESLYDAVINMELSAPIQDEDASDTTTDDSKISARAIVQGLLRAEWRDDDLFQVPLLLNTILEVDASRSLIGEEIEKDLAPKVGDPFAGIVVVWNHVHSRET